ncbi:MAG: hypothetical protein H0Z28_08665 [Archaeoglobus sp.]|nr:hypothetical protein [Archaeoglobus sp.]
MLREIRLAAFFRNAEKFTTSGTDDADPRFVFSYVLLSFILINLSSFDLKLMLAVVAISLAYSALTNNLRRVKSSIIVATPFIIFFSASSFVLTSSYTNMLRSSIFLLTIIFLGSLMLNLIFSNLISRLFSLHFLRVPLKIALALLIALRMLNVYSRDLANIIEIHAINERRRMEFYRKILKAGVSVIMLRAISLAENLYLRDVHGYISNYPPNFSSDSHLKLGPKEIYFILASIGIVIFYLFLYLSFYSQL